MTFVAIFSLITGVLMIAQWIYSLVSRQVPELSTKPAEIMLHILAEGVTALLLIIGGAALLGQSLLGYPLTLLAMGMLLYTLINSSGYFIQRRNWIPVIMFALLLVLALVSTILLFGELGNLVRVG
jgi:hypothetical protein